MRHRTASLLLMSALFLFVACSERIPEPEEKSDDEVLTNEEAESKQQDAEGISVLEGLLEQKEENNN